MENPGDRDETVPVENSRRLNAAMRQLTPRDDHDTALAGDPHTIGDDVFGNGEAFGGLFHRCPSDAAPGVAARRQSK